MGLQLQVVSRQDVSNLPPPMGPIPPPIPGPTGSNLGSCGAWNGGRNWALGRRRDGRNWAHGGRKRKELWGCYEASRLGQYVHVNIGHTIIIIIICHYQYLSISNIIHI